VKGETGKEWQSRIQYSSNSWICSCQASRTTGEY